jgi:hypothetical protein
VTTIDTLSLTLGTAWASGINLYATIFVLGYLSSTGAATLPPALEVLSDPLVMGIAGLMYFIEFFADKTPGVDSGWDAIHTFIRIPAGAVLAASAAQGFEIGPAAELAAALVGGALATGSHLTKAGSRLIINTSPEPVSNWAASFSEDLAVIAGLWAALYHPAVFLILLVLFVLFTAWLLPKLWRAIKALFQKIGRWFSGKKSSESELGRASTEHAEAPQQPGGDRLKQLYNNAERNQD